MYIVPRMDRAERRQLMRVGRKASDFATAMRFYAVALLGGGKTSPTVADLLCIAVSTVVRAAHAYLAEGVEGLHDKRRGNGRPKADGAFRTRVAAVEAAFVKQVPLGRMAKAEEMAAQLVREAGSALDSFGDRANTLKEIARYLVERKK